MRSIANAQKALDSLPARTMRVFILVRFDGLTFEATAERLHMDTTNCRRLFARALSHIGRAADK